MLFSNSCIKLSGNLGNVAQFLHLFFPCRNLTRPHLSIATNIPHPPTQFVLLRRTSSARLRQEASADKPVCAKASSVQERSNSKTKTHYHPNRYFNRRPPKKAMEMLVKVPIK